MFISEIDVVKEFIGEDGVDLTLGELLETLEENAEMNGWIVC